MYTIVLQMDTSVLPCKQSAVPRFWFEFAVELPCLCTFPPGHDPHPPSTVCE